MTTNWTLLVLSLNGFVLAPAVAANGGPQPVVVNRLTARCTSNRACRVGTMSI